MNKPLSARAPATDAISGSRGQFQLRRFSVLNPRVLVVGASTGGPQALAALLPSEIIVKNPSAVLVMQSRVAYVEGTRLERWRNPIVLATVPG